jgi:hypothetical protein
LFVHCTGERVPEEADAGGRADRRRRERGDEEDAGRPGQARGGDLPARGQGQERLHLPRGVQRAEARRTVKTSFRLNHSATEHTPTRARTTHTPIHTQKSGHT